MSGHVRRRSVAAYVVLGGLLLVGVGTSSGAAHPERDRRAALDLASSAHPSRVHPTVSDAAFAEGASREREVDVDAAGTSSATCDGCTAESTTLQVLYVSRARAARLDNSAVAWAQQCDDCTSTSLSVQVVVLRDRPEIVPNNRALALNAACTACRTAAAAFQLVVVADRASRLSAESLAELRTWFDDQSAHLRASVAPPVPAPAPASPTAEPSPGASAPTESTTPRAPGARRRHSAGDQQAADTALAELTGLVATDLAAETVSSDAVLTR